jgi:hypothetical protein
MKIIENKLEVFKDSDYNAGDAVLTHINGDLEFSGWFNYNGSEWIIYHYSMFQGGTIQQLLDKKKIDYYVDDLLYFHIPKIFIEIIN